MKYIELEVRQLVTSIGDAQYSIADGFQSLKEKTKSNQHILGFLEGVYKRLNYNYLSLLDKIPEYTQSSVDDYHRLEEFDERYVGLLDTLERCKGIQLTMDYLPHLFQRLEDIVSEATAEKLEKSYDLIRNSYVKSDPGYLTATEFFRRIEQLEYQMRRIVNVFITQFLMHYKQRIQQWYKSNKQQGFEALLNEHYRLLWRIYNKITATPEGLPLMKQLLRNLESNLKYSLDALKDGTKLKMKLVDLPAGTPELSASFHSVNANRPISGR